MDLNDLPAAVDQLDRLEGIVSTFLNADWDGALQRDGLGGFIAECMNCMTGANAPVIQVSRYSSWSGHAIEQLLQRHGVKIWDRGFLGENLFFRVKRRQAVWAEYLLLRAGVPVVSPPIDPRNREYAERHSPRSEPPNRQWRR
jgi:hypothetical protein